MRAAVLPPFPDYSDTFKQLGTYLLAIEGLDKMVQVGVASVGDPSAYALVWEWGNARQTKEGPKTVLGINPDGEEVWLSIQAPRGYIRILTPQFMTLIRKEMKSVDFAKTTSKAIYKELKAAAMRIADKMAEMIRETVPVDTGDLQTSIQPLFVNDAMLQMEFDSELEI